MNQPFGLFVEVAGTTEVKCLVVLRSVRLPRARREAKTYPLRVEGMRTFIARASSRDASTATVAGDRISLGQKPTWLEATGHNPAAVGAPIIREG